MTPQRSEYFWSNCHRSDNVLISPQENPVNHRKLVQHERPQSIKIQRQCSRVWTLIPHWFQIPGLLLTSSVTLNEFLNLSVPWFPYWYDKSNRIHLIEWLWGLSEFLDQGPVYRKLCVYDSCGCNWGARGMCVQNIVVILSKKGLAVGEVVGEGRFCRRGDARAYFEV